MASRIQRRIQPEILDGLPPDHPDAIASRRDLRRINRVMGNHRWIVSELQRACRCGDRIVELGAGDGELARMVEKKFPDFPGAYIALDLVPEGPVFPKHPAFCWRSENLMESVALEEATIVVANMVLHHFEDEALRELGRRLRHCRLVLAREPARHFKWVRYMLYPLGLNRVTKHDMRISIEAGFIEDELPDTMGLGDPRWRTDIVHTVRGAYALRAVRMEDSECS